MHLPCTFPVPSPYLPRTFPVPSPYLPRTFPVPSQVGFDPLHFGDTTDKAVRERLELTELKNGRLAMLAFSGMLHQARTPPPPKRNPIYIYIPYIYPEPPTRHVHINTS